MQFAVIKTRENQGIVFSAVSQAKLIFQDDGVFILRPPESQENELLLNEADSGKRESRKLPCEVEDKNKSEILFNLNGHS